jgi:hypothetical protein
MSHKDRRQCYGKIFPSTLQPESDKVVSGKALSFELRRIGGLFALDRKVMVDLEEWEGCRACPDFEDCYKLSLGRVSLEAAITYR